MLIKYGNLFSVILPSVDAIRGDVLSGSKVDVLKHLSDGQIHAGTVLADRLGVSRTAIWKHVQSLRESGLAIEAIAGRGYRLPYPIDLLNNEAIRDHLNETDQDIPLHILWRTLSTNDWLRQRAVSQDLVEAAACLAEQQTAGRGTKGRSWYSPLGINLYLSLYWSFARVPSELAGLSLAVAISVIDALTRHGYCGLMVKWPNDIFTGQGKLGGILIDMFTETNGPTRVVIGIGLNYGMVAHQEKLVNRPIDDLKRLSNSEDMDRNKLAALILNSLTYCCRTYEKDGFDLFHAGWKQWDMLKDQQVVIQMENSRVGGIARGIDESGALLLETESGISRYASGEVSLGVVS